MSTRCAEHAFDTRSILELVFAPATKAMGADHNWLAASDKEIVDATLGELERLFPTEIGPGVPGGGAQVLKATVVRVTRSVYVTTPGCNKFWPG